LVMRSLLVLDFWAAYDKRNKPGRHADCTVRSPVVNDNPLHDR